MSDTINLVTMPKWGLAMQEGTIIEWRKAEGQHVVEGEPICDIETTKITNEFESPFTGTLARIAKATGSIVDVGDVIAVITDGAVDESAITALLESRGAAARDAGATAAGPAVRRVDTGVGAFACLETGSSGADQAVLFLHGFGGDHANWGLLQAEVPETVRTIALDLPGHGGSSRDVGSGSAADIAARVDAAVDALGLRQVDLVAHSFGGAVALALAARRPETVRSLLLLAPAALGATVNPDYIRGFLGAERKRDMKPVMEMLFSDPDMVGRTMVNDALALLRDDAARAALGQVGEALLRPAPTEVERDLALLDTHPFAVVWGGSDRIVPMPPALASRLGERLEVLPGVGHMPQAEQPAVVARVLRSLIARV